jgi:hypothetical protein
MTSIIFGLIRLQRGQKLILICVSNLLKCRGQKNSKFRWLLQLMYCHSGQGEALPMHICAQHIINKPIRPPYQYHSRCQKYFSYYAHIIKIYRTIILPVVLYGDRLCGLVVRVSGYRSRGPGFNSWCFEIF